MKTFLERVARQTGLTGVLRRRQQGALVLAYHNVVPDTLAPAGDRSLHLSRSAFAAQLTLLHETCDVVPLDTLLTERLSRRSGRPLVAITFDDGYRGALEFGVAELALRGLPATFFIAPGRLDGHRFWWDRLAGQEGLVAGDRHHALEDLNGRDEDVCAWAVATGKPLLDVPVEMTSGTMEELQHAARSGVVTFGSHTWSHPNMARLAETAVREELARSRSWLEQWDTLASLTVSWPYGLTTTAAEAAAEAAGYRAAFRVDGGWMRNRNLPFALPRWNVPAGVTLDGFELRLAGLLCE